MCKQMTCLILNLCLMLVMIFPVWGNHAIIAYDVSGSMHRLRNGSGYKVFMKEEDFDRLNKYILHLLFSGPSGNILPNDAQISSRLESKPLYTPSDHISLFTFHSSQNDILRMQTGVSQTYLEKQLPNLWGQNPFKGLESFVSRAEIHIYELAEQFYQSKSLAEITHWIMVSDYDEDISTKYEKNPSEMKKLASLEAKYEMGEVYHLLVNRHVEVKVYQVVPKGTPAPPLPVKRGPKAGGNPPFQNFFIASHKSPNQPLREIEFSKSGKWVKSEPLIVKSRDNLLNSFQPQDLTMLIASSGRKIPKWSHNLQPERPLPQGFQIRLPDSKELRNAKNRPEFLLGYNCEGQNYNIPINQPLRFSAPRSNTAAAIFGVLLGLLVLGSAGFAGYTLMKRMKGPKNISFTIEMTDGMFNKREDFTLPEGQRLGFSDDKVNYYCNFDVGCSDSFLINEKGTLILQTPTNPQKLLENDTFSVFNQGGDRVEIKISPANVSQTSETTDPLSSTASSALTGENDPLNQI
ncbi:hypothetical protein H8E77_23075 [bacterium]|nr:hypothetical protein [bacterium]